MADRVRMQSLSLAIVLLGQGTAFVLAGSERLRSKSLDRNSYNSGDWFNRLLWDCKDGNGFGAGLPSAPDNRAYWIYDRPLLADPALQPDCAAINAARNQFREFLRIRRSSPAFSIGSAAGIRKRVSFSAADTPGVISMRIDTTGLDPRWTAVIVIFNASPRAHVQPIDLPAGAQVALHPVQAASLDPVIRQSVFEASSRTLNVRPAPSLFSPNPDAPASRTCGDRLLDLAWADVPGIQLTAAARTASVTMALRSQARPVFARPGAGRGAVPLPMAVPVSQAGHRASGAVAIGGLPCRGFREFWQLMR